VTTNTFQRAEIWERGAAVFAMERLAVVERLLRCEGNEDLAAGHSVEIDLPLADASVASLRERRVLRLVHTTGFRQYRITKIRGLRGESGNVVTVTATDPLLDLADVALMTEQLGSGVINYEIALHQVTVTQALDNYILPASPLWFEKGVIQPTQLLNPVFRSMTPLAALRHLCDLARDPETGRPAELRARWNSGTSKFAIDVLTEIGLYEADGVTLAPIADIRYRKNLRTADRTRDTAQQANIVTPFGDPFPDGTPSGIKHAVWRLTLVSGTLYEITDPEGGPSPVLQDGFLSDFYVDPGDRTPLIEITDSLVGPPSVVQLARTVPVDGAVYQLWDTQFGMDIISLVDEVSLGLYGGKHATVSRPGITGVRNYLANGNPWFRDWTTPTDPPDEWTSFAGITFATYMSQATDPEFTEYGGKSVHFEALNATLGQIHGLVSSTFYPGAVEGGKYFSVKTRVLFTTFSGAAWFYLKVRAVNQADPIAFLMLTAADNTVEQRESPAIGAWVDISIIDMDLTAANAAGVYLEILGGAGYAGSVEGSLSFYVDAVQVSQHTGATPTGYYEYSGANAIWGAGVRALQANGEPRKKYEVDVDDLSRHDGTAYPFDTFTLGSYVRVTDQPLGVAEEVRIVGVPLRDYLVPKRTQLTLATRAELLAEFLNAQAPSTPRLTPTTTKPPETVTGPPGTGGGGVNGARWEVRAVITTHTLTAMPAALTEIDTDLQRHVDIRAFAGGCAVTGRVQP
jgi:hypothetical protein